MTCIGCGISFWCDKTVLELESSDGSLHNFVNMLKFTEWCTLKKKKLGKEIGGWLDAMISKRRNTDIVL